MTNNKYSHTHTKDMMSTRTINPQEITAEEAKKILREARLRDHKGNIAKFLAEKNDEKLATACSGFLALYRTRNKGKDGEKPKGKNEKKQ